MIYDKNIKGCMHENKKIDQMLLLHVQEGDELAVEHLMNKYEGIVRKKANTYFPLGSDREDVIQEGLIGLYKAICDYDDSKQSSFKSFAELCITRQIITSIKSATRLKHTPLNGYISIYKPVQEESDQVLIDVFEYDDAVSPHDQLVTKEQTNNMKLVLAKMLTKLEWEVLHYYIEGYRYEEIASVVGRSEKSIDNALQRVKRKVGQLIQEDVL